MPFVGVASDGANSGVLSYGNLVMHRLQLPEPAVSEAAVYIRISFGDMVFNLVEAVNQFVDLFDGVELSAQSETFVLSTGENIFVQGVASCGDGGRYLEFDALQVFSDKSGIGYAFDNCIVGSVRLHGQYYQLSNADSANEEIYDIEVLQENRYASADKLLVTGSKTCDQLSLNLKSGKMNIIDEKYKYELSDFTLDFQTRTGADGSEVIQVYTNIGDYQTTGNKYYLETAEPYETDFVNNNSVYNANLKVHILEQDGTFLKVQELEGGPAEYTAMMHERDFAYGESGAAGKWQDIQTTTDYTDICGIFRSSD